MIQILKTSGLCISREYEKYDFYGKIKSDLTKLIRGYQRSTFSTNIYYLEGEKVLKIPRFFPIEIFIDDEINIIDKIGDGKDIDISHNISLRDDLQKNIVKYMIENENGIIQANPGSGKTVMGVYVAATIKKKTFILCHRKNLIEQWKGPGAEDKKQGFLGFTDINEDEIGILSSKNFKEVLNKSIILSTDQSFISILKRHREEFLTELNNAGIGLFIADEVHTSVGAPTFAECSIHIPSKRVFGLSATPDRQDGNDIMRYHLGEIIRPTGKSSTMDARVTAVLFDFGFLPKSAGFIYWGGFFQKSRYFKILKNSKLFLSISFSLIKKFYDEGRQILYTGDRIKLLELLHNNCECDNKGMFISGSKSDEIEKQITFTTPSKSRDGIDYISKDCLIMSSPIGNIDQMSGRVCRIKDGKKQPIIIDFVDIGIKEIKKTFINRLNFYKSREWDVKFLFISNTGQKRLLMESEVLEILNE